jgi:hypothetical protein
MENQNEFAGITGAVVQMSSKFQVSSSKSALNLVFEEGFQFCQSKTKETIKK